MYIFLLIYELIFSELLILYKIFNFFVENTC